MEPPRRRFLAAFVLVAAIWDLLLLLHAVQIRNPVMAVLTGLVASTLWELVYQLKHYHEDTDNLS